MTLRYIPTNEDTNEFVALDVEATGFDRESSEIIEVAVCVFTREREIERFETLVKPYGTVPLDVQQLTGITEDMLVSAPAFSEIADKVRSLIGNRPIVGHFINFDLEMLRGAGVAIANRELDTYRLSTALLHELPSYSLGSVAESLGVEFPEESRHRAMPDTIANVEVFRKLLDQIDRYDPRTLLEVARFAKQADWPEAELFSRAADDIDRLPVMRGTMEGRFEPLETAFTEKFERPEPLRQSGAQNDLPVEEIGKLISADGPLATILEKYESRPQQIEMAKEIADAFNDDEHLIVEAGTGTGKSLAYLLPSALYAISRGQRVVIATNTLALQDQLFHKDLPDVRTTLQAAGLEEPLRVAVMKGRDNYLCLSRWFGYVTEPVESPADASLRAKVLLWLGRTKTGDKSELRLQPEEQQYWKRFASERGRCSAKRCAYARNGQCFYARARAVAASAHIVIANHALVMITMESQAVLPPYERLIIDEAHHLEDEATRQFGFSLTRAAIEEAVAQLVRSESGAQQGGLPSAVNFISKLASAEAIEHAPQAVDRQRDLGKVTESARKAVAQLYDAVTAMLPRLREGQQLFYADSLRITESVRTRGHWHECLQHWEDLDHALHQLLDAGRWLLQVLDDLPIEPDDSNPDYVLLNSITDDLQLQLEAISIVKSELSRVFNPQKYDEVHWISRSARIQEISLNGAPLDVSELLKKMVYSRMRSVILTSATLTIDSSFEYMIERLGLQSARTLALGSPFDHQSSTLVYLPADMPEPNAPFYSAAMNDSLIDLLAATEGRALVLFTSYRAMRETRDAIREPLAARNISVQAQGQDGSLRQLIDKLRHSPATVILGTNSFWEGVDIAGPALSLVVITKLPFPVPSDPVFEARGELYENNFMQLSLPQAVLKFKQGFGRLIRSATDVGACVVYDRRVVSKRYGSTFVQSLPPCRVIHGDLLDLPANVSSWLERPIPTRSGSARDLR